MKRTPLDRDSLTFASSGSPARMPSKSKTKNNRSTWPVLIALFQSPGALRVLRILVAASVLTTGPMVMAQPVTGTTQVSDPAIPRLNAEELSQLLAPIALYPDALIAIILPASTVPSDIVLSARFVQQNPSLEFVDNQPWDESVKSLSRYPEVLTWMDENLEWTAAVGEAFVEQPADVMNVIQGLREQARAAGNLKDTPEQKVVVVEEVIRIVPANPEIIYVPLYDPQVVYVQSYSPAPLLSFGVGFAVGTWLNYDFDWNRRCLYRGTWRGWDHNWNRNNNWYGGWGQGGGGNNNQVNVVNIDITNVNQWQASNKAVRQTNQRQRNNNGNARFVSNKTERIAEQQAARLDGNDRDKRIGKYNPKLENKLPRPAKLERQDREQTRARSDANDRDRTNRNSNPDTQPENMPPSSPDATTNPNRTNRQDNQKPGSDPAAVKEGNDRNLPEAPESLEKRDGDDRKNQRPNAQQPGSRPLVMPSQPAPEVNPNKAARQERREAKSDATEATRNPNKADRQAIQTPGSNPAPAVENPTMPVDAPPSGVPSQSDDGRNVERGTKRPDAVQPDTMPTAMPAQPAPKINQERKEAREERQEQQAKPEREQPKPERQQPQPERQQPQPERQQAQPEPQQAQPERQQARPERQQPQREERKQKSESQSQPQEQQRLEHRSDSQKQEKRQDKNEERQQNKEKSNNSPKPQKQQKEEQRTDAPKPEKREGKKQERQQSNENLEKRSEKKEKKA